MHPGAEMHPVGLDLKPAFTGIHLQFGGDSAAAKPQIHGFFAFSRNAKHRKGDRDRAPLDYYNRLLELGMSPNVAAVVGALKVCSNRKDLETGKRIHSNLIKTGVPPNIFVASTLVDMYAKCGSLANARRVFEGMQQRNVVLWNCLILGYAQRGEAEEALNMYSRMRGERCLPDYVTFLGVLKACVSLGEKEAAKIVDGKMMKSGCLGRIRDIHLQAVRYAHHGQLHVFVSNTLIDAYAKCGSVAEAREVFDAMRSHSSVSWNCIILAYAESGDGAAALELFSQMQAKGFAVNYVTFLAALKACVRLAGSEEGEVVDGKIVKVESLKTGRDLHSQAAKGGHDLNSFVGSSLLDMYVKCGSMSEALKVFESLPRSVVSWTGMIMGYAESGDEEIAWRFFRRMQDEGFAPDPVTYVAALKACIGLAGKEVGKMVDGKIVKAASLEKGRDVHTQAATRKGMDVFVSNAVLDLYAKCGSLGEARRFFDGMKVRTVVSWTAMILGCAENGEAEISLEYYERMRKEGCVADCVTFVAALKACGVLAGKEEGKMVEGRMVKLKSLAKGREIHLQAAETGHEFSSFVTSSLMDMYAKCGSMIEAEKIFSRLGKTNFSVVSWNCMILGYAENGEERRALELYQLMQERGFRPVAATYVAALKACGALGDLEAGRAIEAGIRSEAGAEMELIVANSLVDFYGKAGSMADAKQVFDSVRVKDLVTWNALIDGYSRQGDTVSVFGMFEKLEEDEVLRPDEITFLAVLTACSHAGMISKADEYFQAMSSSKYKLVPSVKHYSCMIDLLGRANRLENAVETMRRMPFEPSVAIWMTLLGAAREWKNFEVGRMAFDEIVKVERNATAYVWMSEIYASAGKEFESSRPND